MQQSATIGALAAALAKAQGEFTAVPFNTLNRFLGNRYADLGAVIETAKPILAAYGLSVAQLTEDGEVGAIGITTILMHSSGEWLSSFVSLPMGDEKGKSRAQVAGSIVSYLRRYAFASILGLYAEEETDGNTNPQQTVANSREHEVNRANTVAPKAPPMKPAANLPPPNVGGMAQQNGTPLTPDMPEGAAPAQLREWFTRRLKTIKPLKWPEKRRATKPQALAIDLKQHGFKETDRPDLYEFLTGVKSAQQMSDEQIYLLEANAHRTAELTACAEAMREERAKLSEKLV